MLPIKGLQKTSLVDFPPHTVSTIFLGGCNFRCPYCQNSELVLSFDTLPTISQDHVVSFLSSRKKWLDGVCVTGGEPLLYDLRDFLKKIREIGLLVKLDTNGSFPDRLKSLIDEGLVDYIAMDIKSSPGKYKKAAGADADMVRITRSTELIQNCGLDYEFRITAVPTLNDESDFEEISRWLKGSRRIYIQQFSPKSCLDSSFQEISPYKNEKLEKFRQILNQNIKYTAIR